jgi:uncharacterized lipoprotein YajG
LSKIKQRLEGLGIGDTWKEGGENNSNVWAEIIKRYVDTKKQNMEVNMREKKSMAVYSELKNNWEKEIYVEVCTCDARMMENGHLEIKGC